MVDVAPDVAVEVEEAGASGAAGAALAAAADAAVVGSEFVPEALEPGSGAGAELVAALESEADVAFAVEAPAASGVDALLASLGACGGGAGWFKFWAAVACESFVEALAALKFESLAKLVAGELAWAIGAVG